MPYKIHVGDREYTTWHFYDTTTVQKIKLSEDINPLTSKLISNDVFEINKGVVNILHSSTRCAVHLSGVFWRIIKLMENIKAKCYTDVFQMISAYPFL